MKLIRSLHQKKFREQEGCYLAEGYKVVEEALQSDVRVRMIAGTPEFIHRMKSNPSSTSSVTFVECPRNQLERITTLTTAPDGLAVIEKATQSESLIFPSGRLILALDGIRDPGNLGTLLRLADWFGLAGMVVSPDTVDEYNPKVVQSAMGSLFRQKIQRTHLPLYLNHYKDTTGQPVLAADMEGLGMYSKALPTGCCLVLGNESEGIRNEVLEVCTDRISIPGFFQSGKGPESLNVAVSAAILVAEYRRNHPAA